MKLRWSDLRSRNKLQFALVSLMIFSAGPAESALSLFKTELKEKNAELTELKKQITIETRRFADNKKKIQDFKNNLPANDPTYSGGCSHCNQQSQACDAQDFQVLGITQGQPWLMQQAVGGIENCKLIFDRDPQLTSVSPGCAIAVKQCGPVKRQLAIRELENDNRAIQDDLTNKKEEQKALLQEISDLRQDCPDCDVGVAYGGMAYGGMPMMGVYQQRSPKLADYLVASLPFLTQLGLGGMSLGLGAMTLNNYSDNYSAYLDQCKLVGVPCGQPSYMMGMGGMGLMGMGGIGMGMPMMGGMSLMGMGMPMMGGMSMGMPMMGGYSGGSWMNPYAMMNPGSMMSMGWGYPMSAMGTGYNSALYPYGASGMSGMYMNPYMNMGYNNGQYQSMYGSSMQNQMASQYAQQNQQNLMIAQQSLMDAQQRVMSIQNQGMGGMSSPWSYPMGMGGYPFVR
jgi:hypothetical protein